MRTRLKCVVLVVLLFLTGCDSAPPPELTAATQIYNSRAFRSIAGWNTSFLNYVAISDVSVKVTNAHTFQVIRRNGEVLAEVTEICTDGILSWLVVEQSTYRHALLRGVGICSQE